MTTAASWILGATTCAHLRQLADLIEKRDLHVEVLDTFIKPAEVQGVRKTTTLRLVLIDGEQGDDG
jgi:hypothetical protein